MINIEDTNTAVESAPEETGQIDSPSTEVEPTSQQTTEVPEDLPQDTEEQRKAFQRMRHEIDSLKEEAKARQKSQAAFDVLKPRPRPVSAQGIDINQYVDADTGTVDMGAYNTAVNQLIQQAHVDSAQAAATVEERLDEQNARRSVPQLDLDSKEYDAEFEKDVAARYLFEKFNGNNVTMTQIAKELGKKYSKATTKASEDGAKEALERLSAREQAALAANSQSGGQARSQQSAGDTEELRSRTRFGDERAMTERMSRIPWVKSDVK